MYAVCGLVDLVWILHALAFHSIQRSINQIINQCYTGHRHTKIQKEIHEVISTFLKFLKSSKFFSLHFYTMDMVCINEMALAKLLKHFYCIVLEWNSYFKQRNECVMLHDSRLSLRKTMGVFRKTTLHCLTQFVRPICLSKSIKPESDREHFGVYYHNYVSSLAEKSRYSSLMILFWSGSFSSKPFIKIVPSFVILRGKNKPQLFYEVNVTRFFADLSFIWIQKPKGSPIAMICFNVIWTPLDYYGPVQTTISDWWSYVNG